MMAAPCRFPADPTFVLTAPRCSYGFGTRRPKGEFSDIEEQIQV